MDRIGKKLSSRRGETISEVLVASLISVLALLLLATMIMSASRMVSRSDEKMSLFYEQSSALESGVTEVTDEDKVKLESEPDGMTVVIKPKAAGGAAIASIPVDKTKEKNSGLTSYK